MAWRKVLNPFSKSTSKSSKTRDDGGDDIITTETNFKNPTRSSVFIMDNLNVKDFSDDEIKQCFRDFDLDQNGFLCAAEIKHCFSKLGETVTDEEMDQMIKMCDENGDGQVELEEFQTMIYREAGIHRKGALQSAVTKASMADVSVLKTQRNKKQKLVELLQKLEFESKSMKDIRQNFLLVERSSDTDAQQRGLVDFADFCACTKVKVDKNSKDLFGMFQHDNGDNKCIDSRLFLISLVGILASNIEMKIKYTFDIFDIDGNGLIDRHELSTVVAATQLLKGKHLTERVNKIMELADKDGNQELDFNEFAVCCRRYAALVFPSQ